MSSQVNSNQSDHYKVDNSSPRSGGYLGKPGSPDYSICRRSPRTGALIFNGLPAIENMTWPIATETSACCTTDPGDDSSNMALKSPTYSPPTPQPLFTPEFRHVDSTSNSPTSPRHYTGESPTPDRLSGGGPSYLPTTPSYVLTGPGFDTADPPSTSPLSYCPTSPSHYTRGLSTPDRLHVPTTPSYVPTSPRFNTAYPPPDRSPPTYAPTSPWYCTGHSPTLNHPSGSTSSYAPNGFVSHRKELSSLPDTPAIGDAATSIALHCRDTSQSSRLTSVNAKLPRLRVADSSQHPSHVVGASSYFNAPKTAGGFALKPHDPNMVERSTPSALGSPPPKRRKISRPNREDNGWVVNTRDAIVSCTQLLDGSALITVRARDGVKVLVQSV
ncbi:hypothetical protein BKA63DRAFT_587524 [Paraphoma chrysanthemicola]|nr:hypothetical protein BKA63DRAFT_587524 [Paraphoma chrysanthemicola]